MHLKTIRLRSWACHDDLRVALRPELNVCVGPNGAGKSTLYQAIVTALTVKHSSSSEEVKAARPWGSDGCGPSVTLEVVRGDGDWQLSKTYLHEAFCTLESRRDGQGAYKLEKRNQLAEAHLDGWLEGDGAAGRLILALWSAQDDPIRIFADLSSKGAKHIPATLLEQFAGDSPAAEASGPFGHLKRAIRVEYESRLTPEQKKVKKNSPLDKARRALADAEARLAEIRERREKLNGKVEEFQARQARHDSDCAGRARLRERKEARDRDLIRYREAAEALHAAEAVADRLLAEFEASRAAGRRLRQATEALHAAEATASDLGRRQALAKEAADALRKGLEAQEARRREADGPLDALANLFAARERLEEKIERLDARTREAARLRGDRARAVEALATAKQALASAVVAKAEADRVATAALQSSRRAAVRAAEEELRRSEAALRRAEAAGLARERSRLVESRAMVREWQSALEALPVADGQPIPTEADLSAIRKADRELASLGADLAGDALTLRFLASGAVSALVATDGREPSEIALDAGGVFEGEGVASLSIAIEGVGRIEVGRTAEDVAARVEGRERLRADLGRRLSALGAGDLESLEARRDAANERERLRVRIEGRLAGGSLIDWEARIGQIDALLDGVEIAPDAPGETGANLARLKTRCEAASHALSTAKARCEGEDGPAIEGDLPDVEEADRLAEAARKRLDLAARSERAAETALIRVEEALKVEEMAEEDARHAIEEESGGLGKDEARADLRTRIDDAQQPLIAMGVGLQYANSNAVLLKRNELKNEAEAARKRFAEADPAARDADLRAIEAEADLKAKRARLEEVRAEIGPPHDPEAREAEVSDRERLWLKASVEVGLLKDRLPADPDADASAFQAEFEAAHRTCDEGEVELGRLRAELEVEGAQGLDTQHARAEEERDRARNECERLGREASAWALLHHLLAEVEEGQAKGIAARLEQLAAGLVCRLTGGNVLGVTIDPKNLAPALATVEGVASPARIGQFSRGTREQVALTCRLQIGRLLGREARHMLLLDDPLAHTDPARHEEALRELEELSKTLQVIIFTCHRDRYGPLFDGDKARKIEIPGRAR